MHNINVDMLKLETVLVNETLWYKQSNESLPENDYFVNSQKINSDLVDAAIPAE